MVDVLKNLYLFKTMSDQELSLINEIAVSDALPAGEEVFSQSNEATALYIVKLGSVRIYRTLKTGDPIEVAVLGSGSHLGEMALLDGEKRSASATTIERTELIRIDFDKLHQLLEKNNGIAVKFYKAIATFLCGRLRVTTEDLSFAREKNLRYF